MKKIGYVILLFVISATLLSAQSKLGIGVGGLFLSPTGDFGDVYKSGFGGTGALTFDASNNLQFSVNVGYAQLSFNNDKYNQILSDFFSAFGTKVNVDVQSKLKIIPIMLGGKYFLTNSNFRPYAAVDIGVHILSVDASSVTVNGQSMTAVESQSKTATAWGLGAGFQIKVGSKINLDVNAKINGNNLETSQNMSASSSGFSSSSSSNATTTFFSVGAGLMFEL